MIPLVHLPSNPANDPQFSRWEYGVQSWFQNGGQTNFQSPINTNQNSNLPVSIVSPVNNYNASQNEKIVTSIFSTVNLQKADYFLNGAYIGTSNNYPYSISFIPGGVGAIIGQNTLRVVATDPNGNTGESSVTFSVK